jgi:hypothetical protein
LSNKRSKAAGYTKVKAGDVVREVAYLLPDDDAIGFLTYDLDLLIEAVRERRYSGRSYHLSPDEIAAISSNRDWTTQCWIAEQIVDYAVDYDLVPDQLR